jgi:hypothetical protein
MGLVLLLFASCSSGHKSPSPSSTSSTTTNSSPSPSSAASSTPGSTPSATAPGPEGPVVTAPELAPAGATGETIDGIACAPIEQLVYHIHAHLSVFVNGQPRAVPFGIGIVPPLQTQPYLGQIFVTGGKCIYWLHTHAADGIMHVESPTAQAYTLQNFFDIWHQPLSTTQVGPAQGQVTLFVNGKQSSEDPRLISLDPHAVIQLDVGQPVVPPGPYTFASGL